MAWIYLILASVLEACWMFSLKSLSFSKLKTLNFDNLLKTEGLYVWLPLAGYIVFGIANTYYLSIAMKSIPTAVAFSIWTAVSIVFIEVVEVTFFQHKISLTEFFFLGLIMIGVIGLKVVAKS